MKLLLFDKDYLKIFPFKTIFSFATILSIMFIVFGGYNLYKNYKIYKTWNSVSAKITNIKIVVGIDTKGLLVEYQYVVKEKTYTGNFETLSSGTNYLKQLKNKYKINSKINIKYNPSIPKQSFYTDSGSTSFFIIFMSGGIISFFIFGGITLFLVFQKDTNNNKENISHSNFQPNIKILTKKTLFVVMIYILFIFYFFDYQIFPVLFMSLPFLLFLFGFIYLFKNMFTVYIKSNGIKSLGYKFPFFTLYYMDYNEIIEVKKKGIILKYLFLYSSKSSYIKVPLFIDNFQTFKNKVLESTDENNKLRLYLQNNMT